MPTPESGAVALEWFAKAVTERSKGKTVLVFRHAPYYWPYLVALLVGLML
ncbi:MAG: hypothetical protein JO227_24340 [Acetobacteraceae bacterium]|nr:hypothetical protein [Acetobacteraceae bacterium]